MDYVMQSICGKCRRIGDVKYPAGTSTVVLWIGHRARAMTSQRPVDQAWESFTSKPTVTNRTTNVI